MSGIEAPSTGLRGGAEVFGRNGSMSPNGDNVFDVATTLVDSGNDDLYPGFPTSTTPVELFATGTTDDAPGEDGAIRIRVLVLKSIASKSYEWVEIEMNGTTAVSIGECYRAIYAEVLEFGSEGTTGKGANGEIVIAASGGAEYCTIPATDGQSEECVYTVPAGLSVDIRRIRSVLSLPTTGGSTSCRLSLLVRKFGSGGFVPERTFLLTNQRPGDYDFVIPLTIEPLSDVKLQVSGLTTASSQLNATLDFGP